MIKKIKKHKKKILIGLIIALLVIIIFGLAYLYVYIIKCENLECFNSKLMSCKKASFLRTDEQATWNYRILGRYDSNRCKVEVKLIRIKQGKIDIERLEGLKMICNTLRNGQYLPESETADCTGKLKEELQDIIIQRMHRYILENIGEIKQSFSGL